MKLWPLLALLLAALITWTALGHRLGRPAGDSAAAAQAPAPLTAPPAPAPVSPPARPTTAAPAPTNPAGLASVPPRNAGLWTRLADAKVLQSQERTTPEGNIVRTTLVDYRGKYPRLLVRETFAPTPGGPTTLSQVAMVADHMLVQRAKGVTAAAFEQAVAQAGMTIRSTVSSDGLYLIAFGPAGLDALDQAVATLSRINPVAFAEPDYVVTSADIEEQRQVIVAGSGGLLIDPVTARIIQPGYRSPTRISGTNPAFARGELQKKLDTLPAGTRLLSFDPPAFTNGNDSFSPYLIEQNFKLSQDGATPADRSVYVQNALDYGHPNNGSYYLRGLSEAYPLTIQNAEAVPFTLVCVDLAEPSLWTGAISVTFTGYKATGGTVTQTFTTDGVMDSTGPQEDFQTFNFSPAFNGLTRVEVTSPNYMIDNLGVLPEGAESPAEPAPAEPVLYQVTWDAPKHALDQVCQVSGPHAPSSINFGQPYVRAAVGPMPGPALEMVGGTGNGTFGSGYQQIRFDVGRYAQLYRLEFDAYLDQPDEFRIFADSSPGSVAASWTLSPGTYPAGQVFKVRVDVDLTNRTGRLFINGVAGATTPLAATVADLHDFRLHLTGANAASRVGIDNVLISASGSIPQPNSGPTIHTAGSLLIFPSTPLGSTYNQQIELQNIGGQTLTVNAITASNPSYQVAESLPAQILPRGILPVNVAFRPTTVGSQNGTLTIFTNDPVNPAWNVTLTGTASDVPTVALTPTSLSVTQPQNTTTMPTLGIANIGIGSLTWNLVPDYAKPAPGPAPHPTITPSDTFYSLLYGLQDPGVTGAGIDATHAWSITTGSAAVTVAVIDSGVDSGHPDLTGNIDTANGWNFITNTNNPADDNGHGTHVAGTIAARGNNALGVTGVSWNCRIVALKFLDANGNGFTSDAIKAVNYAAARNIRITNNSWGGGSFSQGLHDAILNSGALFVAAAGNAGNDNDAAPHYPSSYDCGNILAVAATDHTDTLANFSEYGATSVDLAAPGASIASTYPGNQYAYMSGTSMATPHASGAAALLLSRDPALNSQQLKQLLMAGTDPKPGLVGRMLSGGRLNVYSSLRTTYAAWITPQASSGTVAAGGSDVVSFSIQTQGLAAGSYAQNFYVDSNDPLKSRVLFPVNLQVTNPAPSTQLTVTLVPGTGQWRIDGGAWQSSGATVGGLTAGNHTIDYSSLAGYSSPASETVTLTDGLSLSLNRSYTGLGAQLIVILSPVSGQWRVDGGAWQASGATVTGLAAGNHTITYNSLPGYSSPATETVTLTNGQSLSLNRSYTTLLAQLTVNLTPASGQWRVDGGVWRASGVTVTGLAAGSHTVDYSSLAGYTAPAPESVSLSAGQALALTRSYTAVPAQLTITLTPASGQWRVDGGAWQGSGATVSGLAAGNHLVDYKTLAGYSSPATEPVTLTNGQSLALNRSYTAMPYAAVNLGTLGGTLSHGADLNLAGVVTGYSWPTGGTDSRAFRYSGGTMQDLLGFTSYAYAINDAGTVVGRDGRAFSHSNGTKLSLGSLGGVSSQASGINNAGTIVGYAELASGAYHAFRYSGGTMQDLGTLGGTNSAANGINEAGVIVGRAALAGNSGNHAFRYSGDTMQDLGTLGGSSSEAYAINEAGVIVGYSSRASGGERAFRYSGGTMEDLGALETTTTSVSGALDINEAGDIVGYASVGTQTHAFLYRAGTLYDLNALVSIPGVYLKFAYAINDLGQIVADGSDSRAYLLTPVNAPGGLQLDLTPATGQWRVDGGAWQASGTPVLNLAVGTHTVEYGNLGGYTAPAAETVTVESGRLLQLSRAYAALPEPAQLTLTLTPATGQWRVDGGAWQASGATVAGLSAGSHTIEYLALAGYTSPAAESIALSAGQSLALARSYVALPPPAQLTVVLTPSAGQWRIDGGAWQASGTTVTGLTAGSHTVDYNSLAGYSAPAAESVTLSAGQSLSLSRSYTALPAQLTITLTPATGQWRIDGGAWRASAATVTGLAAGNHTVEYNSLAGYTSPASETVALAAGQSLSLNRSYTALPTGPAHLTVTLTPGSGKWRLDGGTWRGSGTSLYELTAGSHLLEYGDVNGYAQPPAETITLLSGMNTVLRSYTELAIITVNLTPANARWRLDGSLWRSSGFTFYNVSLGQHLVEYYDPTEIATLAPETVTLSSGPTTLNRTLSAAGQTAQLTVTLTPSTGQWRVDGGAWLASAATATGLAVGNHTVEYKVLAGYTSPASETVSLTANQSLALSRSYTAQPTQLTINLTPATGQWRVDSGAWQPSGATVQGLVVGNHTVEYQSLAGYTSPATETVTLTVGQLLSLNRSYTAQPAQLSITLTPTIGQWRVDAGAWQPSDATLSNLAAGQHSVDYASLEGFASPPAESVTLTAGQSVHWDRSYAPLASVNVVFDPVGLPAQWRLDGGAWQFPGTTLNHLSFGVQHTVEFAPVEGYVTPPAQTFTLTSGELRTLTATYAPLASVNVVFDPVGLPAQWRLDGGAWQFPGTTLNYLSFGVPHTVEFAAIEGYVTPPAQTFTLTSGELRTLTATYAPLASVNVVFDPVGLPAQWRLDGGAWQFPGTTLNHLSFGVTHTVEFAAVEGYVTPSAQTFTLASGELRTLTATYAPLASVNVVFDPVGLPAQWRLDGGAWQFPGTTLNHLSFGVQHTVEFAAVEGYVTPPAQTFTLASGELRTLLATYTAQPVAAFTVTDLGTLGGSSTYAAALNLAGTVTGFSTIPGGAFHAFRNNNGVMEDLGTLGGSYSQAYGINDAGAVVGTSGTADGFDRGFLFKDGFMQILPNLGGPRTEVYAINNKGTIVGFSQDAELAYRAFRYRNGAIEDLGTLGGRSSVAMGLDESDRVVGMAMIQPDNSQYRAFLRDESAMQNLGSLGGDHSQANGINETGVIVGSSRVAGNVAEHIFRYQDGTMVDLGSLGGSTSRAYGINDSGTIVGTATDASENFQAFIYRNGVIQNLNLLVTLPGVTLTEAIGPNDLGQIAANGSNSRAYLLTPINAPGGAQVTLVPTSAFWRVDGGNWVASGTPVLNLAIGNHVVEYSDVAGYTTPAAESVAIASGRLLQLSRTYQAPPPPAQVTVTLTPAIGQWRVDGGAWQASGATVGGLTAGNHTVSYNSLAGYTSPATETVALAAGQALSLNRSYSALPTGPADLTVTLTPASGKWRLDGGNWRSSSQTVYELTPGPHLLEFSDVNGYAPPAAETITLLSGANTVQRAYTELAIITVNLTPANAKWRLDGSLWRGSGFTFYNVPLGQHLIEYYDPAETTTLAPETVTLASGPTTLNRTLSAASQPAQLTITLTPATGQWRVDGGAWRASAATVTGLTAGNHTVEYNSLAGYTSPATETVALSVGQALLLNRSYTASSSGPADLTVTLTPASGKWRLDGGTWRSSSQTVYELTPGPHLLEFSDVNGYAPPAAETITLLSGANTVQRAYTELAIITVNLTPANAKWRLDGSLWRGSGFTFYNVPLGQHLIEYYDPAETTTLAPETVTLTSGPTTLNRTLKP